MPFWTHVDEVEGSKRPPRRSGQSSGSSALQPAGTTAQTADPDVEGRTRTACGGLPIWIVKEDHGPSFPSLRKNGQPPKIRFQL